MARAIESVAADVGRYYRRFAVSLDAPDFEADLFADELPVAPPSDRGRPYELPAPVVHNATVRERREESLDVVRVCGFDQFCYGRRNGGWCGDDVYLSVCDQVANGHRRPIATCKMTPRPIALRPA